jgi:hypothetical protein
LVEVDRRGQEVALHGHRGMNRLHAAAGAEQVAELALGGTHGELPVVLAEAGLDRLRLGESPSGVLCRGR